MTSPYENASCRNIFQQLDDESSLCILSLCLASHDLVLHHRLMNEGQSEEGFYHFAVSLSILRETAKIIQRIDKSSLTAHFLQDTGDMFKDIKKTLLPFEDGAVTKGTLKPIRDLTFHYVFATTERRIELLLDEIRNESKLLVRATSEEESIFRHRYTFADVFRTKLIESYLTKDAKAVVDQISVVVVQVIAFTDSLLADLSQAE